MDFFGAQEAAKKRTTLAIFLFALGVIATALAVYAAVVWILFSRSGLPLFDLPVRLAFERPDILGWSLLAACGVILGASFYKISSMSEGGL